MTATCRHATARFDNLVDALGLGFDLWHDGVTDEFYVPEEPDRLTGLYELEYWPPTLQLAA